MRKINYMSNKEYNIYFNSHAVNLVSSLYLKQSIILSLCFLVYLSFISGIQISNVKTHIYKMAAFCSAKWQNVENLISALSDREYKLILTGNADKHTLLRHCNKARNFTENWLIICINYYLKPVQILNFDHFYHFW